MRLTIAALLATGCSLVDLGLETSSTHPCLGHRTDTVWFDDADTFYVGCGTTTEGRGLYRSDDGGRSWAPVEGFEEFRVDHVHRADGRLYIAGLGSNDQRVVELAGDGSITPIFSAAGQLWNNFQVHTFLTLPDGSAMAESLTGSDVAFRTPEGTWTDAYGWWEGDESFQILDATVHQGRFVGVGSTITQPPKVFVQSEGEGLRMVDRTLSESAEGEVWSIHSDGSGLIAGGVDQDNDIGWVFWTDGDPLESWQTLAVDSVLTGEPTWVHGVCRQGAHLVAVGAFSRRSDGFVIESMDGGGSWTDVSPEGAPVLSQCAMREDRVVIVGADGYFLLR